MQKPLVEPELIEWLEARYPGKARVEPVRDVNIVNFEAGQQSVIDLLRRLSQSRSELD